MSLLSKLEWSLNFLFKMAPKRSEVWLHFTAIDETKEKCDLCKSNFSYKGATNLKRHLETRHPTVLQKSTNRTNPISRPDSDSTLENGSAPSTANSVMLTTTPIVENLRKSLLQIQNHHQLRRVVQICSKQRLHTS